MPHHDEIMNHALEIAKAHLTLHKDNPVFFHPEAGLILMLEQLLLLAKSGRIDEVVSFLEEVNLHGENVGLFIVYPSSMRNSMHIFYRSIQGQDINILMLFKLKAINVYLDLLDGLLDMGVDADRIAKILGLGSNLHLNLGKLIAHHWSENLDNYFKLVDKLRAKGADDRKIFDIFKIKDTKTIFPHGRISNYLKEEKHRVYHLKLIAKLQIPAEELFDYLIPMDPPIVYQLRANAILEMQEFINALRVLRARLISEKAALISPELDEKARNSEMTAIIQNAEAKVLSLLVRDVTWRAPSFIQRLLEYRTPEQILKVIFSFIDELTIDDKKDTLKHATQRLVPDSAPGWESYQLSCYSDEFLVELLQREILPPAMLLDLLPRVAKLLTQIANSETHVAIDLLQQFFLPGSYLYAFFQKAILDSANLIDFFKALCSLFDKGVSASHIILMLSTQLAQGNLGHLLVRNTTPETIYDYLVFLSRLQKEIDDKYPKERGLDYGITPILNQCSDTGLSLVHYLALSADQKAIDYYYDLVGTIKHNHPNAKFPQLIKKDPKFTKEITEKIIAGSAINAIKKNVLSDEELGILCFNRPLVAQALIKQSHTLARREAINLLNEAFDSESALGRFFAIKRSGVHALFSMDNSLVLLETELAKLKKPAAISAVVDKADVDVLDAEVYSL